MKSSVNVIYHDNHILVIDKPGGLSTQPHGEDNLEDRAKEWVKTAFNKPGRVFLTPIHRLDKPVSGLVLFARTSKALSRLQQQMRDRQIQKFYYARVEGHLKEKKGVMTHFLKHGNHRAEVVPEHEGKEAILLYTVLQEEDKTTILEIKLETGRYHQIRAQFSHMGHPVCGDVKYGAQLKAQISEIDLVHGKLVFHHPVSKEELTFSSSFLSRFF